MVKKAAPIRGKRLDLISFTPEILEACLNEERDKAEALLGMMIPDDWYLEKPLMRVRLAQLEKNPGLQPWLMRAIGLRNSGTDEGALTMAGFFGFHSSPGPAYLEPYAPGGVEFGYMVFPEYRRCGYAQEAAELAMAWAYRRHRVKLFVVSISPENKPSMRLAHKMGFTQVGELIDEEDGLEHVMVLPYRRKR